MEDATKATVGHTVDLVFRAVIGAIRPNPIHKVFNMFAATPIQIVTCAGIAPDHVPFNPFNNKNKTRNISEIKELIKILELRDGCKCHFTILKKV